MWSAVIPNIKFSHQKILNFFHPGADWPLWQCGCSREAFFVENALQIFSENLKLFKEI
jgi:hypothetical protein